MENGEANAAKRVYITIVSLKSTSRKKDNSWTKNIEIYGGLSAKITLLLLYEMILRPIWIYRYPIWAMVYESNLTITER